jgi:RNA polymerase sigma-70 factor (ECF subfamily)
MRDRFTSDDDLMRAAAGGDETAFAALVYRHRGWVRALIHGIVHDADHAEDLAQEAFCRVYRRLDAYLGQDRFVPWVKRIAVNLARDFLRSHRRLALVPVAELEDARADLSRLDPMEVLSLGVLRDEIRNAIQSLSEDQRLTVVRYYFGDMSLQEIAREMGCPVGTVKSRLYYALRRIRRSLTEAWAAEEGGHRR